MRGSRTIKTLYDLLGVRSDADDDSIAKAFRNAVKAYHPDLHGSDPKAAPRFQEVVAAIAVLRDPDRRAAYDLKLRLERQRRREWATAALLGVVASAIISAGLVSGRLGPARTVLAGVPPFAAGELPANGVEVRAALAPAAQTSPPDEAEVRAEPHTEPDAVRRSDTPTTGGVYPTAAASDVEAALGDREVAGRGLPVSGPSVEVAFYRDQAIAACRNADLGQESAALDHIIDLDPSDAHAYHMRGNLRDDMGDRDRALADYDNAIRLDPNEQIFHDRGILWQRAGKFDRAIVDLDRAIRLTFSDARTYSDRGFVWYLNGNYDRAVADFGRAFEIDPAFAGAYIERGVMLHRNGICDSLVDRFDPAIQVDANTIKRGLDAKRSR